MNEQKSTFHLPQTSRPRTTQHYVLLFPLQGYTPWKQFSVCNLLRLVFLNWWLSNVNISVPHTIQSTAEICKSLCNIEMICHFKWSWSHLEVMSDWVTSDFHMQGRPLIGKLNHMTELKLIRSMWPHHCWIHKHILENNRPEGLKSWCSETIF